MVHFAYKGINKQPVPLEYEREANQIDMTFLVVELYLIEC